MAKRRKTITPEQFIRAWQTHDTVDAVVEFLGLPKHLVNARAQNYRKKGLPLKKMQRVRADRIDVKKMKELIKKLEQEAKQSKQKRSSPDKEAS